MQRTRLHKWFAKWFVWKRYGHTHWSSGSLFTFDPDCPMCRVLRLAGRDNA